jgi:DNA-binding response OmpR family regulator
MARILLVEDESELATVVASWLCDELHVIEIASNGLDAQEYLRTKNYDLVILDVIMPGASGIEVCKRYRESGGSSPILLLTARSSINDKEVGLDAGADDYLTKPFNLRELSARVRALIRRSQTKPIMSLQVGSLTLEPKSCVVMRNGVALDLHPKEFMILEFFMRNPDEVFAADELISNIWGSNSKLSPETVRTYMKTLRKKIDAPNRPSLIQNIRGIGYKLSGDHV